jgi:hypothetical protein
MDRTRHREDASTAGQLACWELSGLPIAAPGSAGRDFGAALRCRTETHIFAAHPGVTRHGLVTIGLRMESRRRTECRLLLLLVLDVCAATVGAAVLVLVQCIGREAWYGAFRSCPVAQGQPSHGQQMQEDSIPFSRNIAFLQSESRSADQFETEQGRDLGGKRTSSSWFNSCSLVCSSGLFDAIAAFGNDSGGALTG